MQYKIGDLAKLTGYSPETIRHYEHLGILGSPARSKAGQRLYGKDHLQALYTIKAYRNTSFGLQDIGELLAEISTPHFCDKIGVLYDKYSKIFAEKRAELDAAEAALSKMRMNCEHCELKHSNQSGKNCIAPDVSGEKPAVTRNVKIKLP